MNIPSELMGVFAAAASFFPIGFGSFLAYGFVQENMQKMSASDEADQYLETSIRLAAITAFTGAAAVGGFVGTSDYREDFFSYPWIDGAYISQQAADNADTSSAPLVTKPAPH